MKKYILDLTVRENTSPHEKYVLLKMTSDQPLPEMAPGQFAEIRIDGSQSTLLRRPISINYVAYEKDEVWFLVAKVGEGT
ncbi:MAG: dihydroorotate dehydrogenase electron transfer subunit, partial [Bacteroidales bacterium]|nr:dihydroorotate dehydrogenase electron transfer subunit [Bacteroidales bacterium]